LMASTAIAGLGWLGIWWFSPQIESYYVVPFALGVICLPMIALGDMLQGLARAHSWAIFALAPTYIVRPILILVFMGAALIAGYQPCAETAIIAAILATYSTTIAQLAGVT